MRDILKEFTEKRKSRKAKNKPVRIATTLGALAVAALVMWSLMVPGIAMGDDDNQADEVTIELADESETSEVTEETAPEDTSEYTGGGIDTESDSSDTAGTSDASDNSNASDDQDKTAGGDTSADHSASVEVNSQTTENSAGNEDNSQDATDDAANTSETTENSNGSVNTNANAQKNQDSSESANGAMQKINNQNPIDNSNSSDYISQENTNNSDENIEIQEENATIDACGLLIDEVNEEENIEVVDATDDDEIHEGVTVTVSPKKIEGIEGDGSTGGNGQTLKVNVTSTSSSAEQEENKKIKLEISALPEGVTLAGFDESGKMVVEYATGSGKQSITLEIEDGENGEKYVTYEQPAGSTISFELTFNSTNGTMGKESTVTVTPTIEDKDEDKDTYSGPVELKWTGGNKWDNLQKTVDETEINVTKDEEKNDQLGDILTYTISAEQHNGDQNTDTGAIWTKEVTLKDTLALPNGMKFTEGTKVSDDKLQIVDGDGNTIFSFTNLPNYAEVTSLTLNENTVTYEIVVTNPYIGENCVPTKEMDNISLQCQLVTSKVLIKENYTSQEQASADEIKNKVEIETKAYKGDDAYKDSKEVVTTPKLNNNFTITKTANQTEVKPGDAIQYTITINNTGNLPLSADKEVTDTLPDYLVLTKEQKKALENNGATVSTENGKTTITWKPEKIAVGEIKSLEFEVNVASAEEMKNVSDNTTITNKATYSDSEADSTIIYKKPKLEIKKSNNRDDGTLKNGDIITYTITIENKEGIATAAQTIEDNLQKGLIFQNMVDKNGDAITLTEDKFNAESSIEGTDHEVTLTQNGQILTWSLGTLAPNEKVTLYYTCKVDTDQLDSGVTTIKNTAKSTTTGEKSEENKNDVENAISIDKKVDGEKKDTYTNGDIIDYSITIKNADGDAASKATDLILKDVLPAGLVPVYELYSLNDTSKDFEKGEITANDLTKIATTFEEYVKNSDYTKYYIIIDKDVVRVTKEYGSADLRSVTLEWYIGYMTSGQVIEKKYEVKLCMSDSQIETGKEVTYKNTATIKNVSDSEEIKGKDNSGTIILEKQVKGSLKYDNLTEDQKEAIKFKITCENPVYSEEVKLSEFTKKESEKATYTLSKLPYGTYTITETGYDGTKFDGYQDTITIEVGNHRTKGSSVNVTISEGSKATANIKIKNEYATTDSPSVDIQKSVWAIEDVSFDEWGNQKLNCILSSKSIFDKSSNTGTKDGIYVIYNISVMNTGDKKVHFSEIVDELPEGLTYVGMRPNLYNRNVSDFNNGEITTDQYGVGNETSLNGSDVLGDITITNEDNESSSVIFKVGEEGDGIDLEKGKALSFFIMCKVDSDVDIDTSLTNTAKLIVEKTVEYKEYGCVTMKGTGHDDKQNNGNENEVIDKEDIRKISSSVTIKPTKSIVPGITKTAIGYIGTGKAASTMTEFTDENKKNSISPQSTIKWEIELINDGTVPITEYSITDTVDAPFHILTTSEANSNLKITSPFTLKIGDSTTDLSEKVWSTVADDTQQKFTVSISAGDNLTIPVGGKAILTVYTKNDRFSTGIYKNEAIFTPVVQGNVKFDGDSVVNGELVKDSSGKYTGVKASDSVYALGDYGSFSWKSITEKDNETNYGVGYESHNYITIDGETSKDVIYTNNIENVSRNPFQNLVIMDLMPYEGDTGVLNKNDRGSQFSVTFSDNLKIYDKSSESDSNPTEVSDYKVFFSSETSFTEAEMKGTLDQSVWHTTWNNGDKSFCVVLPTDYKLESSHILTLKYEGTIGEDASPGEIAWNSFGYYYEAQTDSFTQGLRAEPPKVGVMIKKQSTIRKEVVDSEGVSQSYDEDKMFTFTIYEGANASDTSLGSFQICQGGFVNLHELKDVNTGDLITLESGHTYTVTETDTNGCNFDGVGKEGEKLSDKNTYTFTYSTGEAITIIFKNKMSSYVLPSTGGVGVARYFAGGALLMSITALLYGCLWRHKRERRLR